MVTKRGYLLRKIQPNWTPKRYTTPILRICEAVIIYNYYEIAQVPLHLQSPAYYYPELPGCLMGLDSIEIHRDATVDDLKALILTLPAVSLQ